MITSSRFAMERPRPRRAAATISLIFSFLFLAAGALRSPILPAKSPIPAAAKCSSGIASSMFPGRRSLRRGRANGGPWRLSSSRASRLGDAIASATKRVVSASSRMSISSGSLDVSIFPGIITSGSTGGRGAKLTIKASHLDPSTGVRRTWTATRSEKDFFALGVTLMGQLGGGPGGPLDRQVPAGPPRGSAPAVYQVYLRRLIDIPDATSLPALYEFLDTPAELVQEPVLYGEVVDDAFWSSSAGPYRSANPDDPRSASSYPGGRGGGGDGKSKSGATVAGAVVGGLVAGPVGAAIGALAVRAASGREDGVGEVAKGAGAVADAAMEKAQALEREFELSRKAKTAAGKAKKAVEKVDSEYSVRRRAREAAGRTVRAAQKTSRDLRVSERAARAARATEQAARKAAEAARRADEEHRLRERAGNALRRVRSRVKRSVENVEGRRRKDERGEPEDRH